MYTKSESWVSSISQYFSYILKVARLDFFGDIPFKFEHSTFPFKYRYLKKETPAVSNKDGNTQIEALHKIFFTHDSILVP